MVYLLLDKKRNSLPGTSFRLTHQTVNFSFLSCFYLFHPVFFSPLFSILSLLLCSGLTSDPLALLTLLCYKCVLCLPSSSAPFTVSLLLLYLHVLYSAVLSPMQLCHHLLCHALNNFASPSPIPLYSAISSPYLLCVHPLSSAPPYFTLFSPTRSALTHSTLLCSCYFSTLLCSNLVLYCILTYPTLLLLVLCNHLTWLGTCYWCT